MKLQFVKILMVGVVVTAFASCAKDLLKTNTDPSAVSVDVFDPNNILTTAQLYYTGGPQDVEETEILGAGYFIQHFASISPYMWGDKYLLSTGGFSYFFDNTYTSAVKYVVDLVSTTAGKSQYANLHQIGRIMKALTFQRITDVYGDVPYFNAGQAYHKSVYFPTYDKQQDIYADLIKEVSEAVDSLDENADQPTGDMFYSGSSDQIGEWKKFGNSLLLRIGMRLTKVDPGTAQAIATKVQGLTMESDDDNAIIHHGSNDLTISKIYTGVGRDGTVQLDWQISDTFINFLKFNQDPRLPVFSFLYDSTIGPLDPSYDPYNPDGTADPSAQEGLPNGYDGSSPAHGIIYYPGYLGSINQYSRPSPLVFNPTAPTLILTYAETELLLADAAARWGIGNAGDAELHYNNGVTASMTQLSVYPSTDGLSGAIDPDDITAYLTAHKYDPADGLEMINTQYWVTTFLDNYEAWSNYRRTGFPNLVPVAAYPGSQSPGAIPRRMEYSTNEKQVNPNNYQAAVANLPGGDKVTSRMWWDVAN